MEKKYYFRGLGLGIIVTAVIMGIALSDGGKQTKMTDDEVIARAKELGMIEDSTLLESAREEDADETASIEKENAVEKDDPVKKDIAVAEKKEEDEKAEAVGQQEELTADQEEMPTAGAPESLQQKEDKAAKPEETEKPEADDAAEKKPTADTNEMTKQDEDIPAPETAAKSITVSSGDSSYTVAKKLAEAGVVSSAEAYDDYLCANGYDKKLRPGTFEIPAQAGDEEIAKIVTRQQ